MSGIEKVVMYTRRLERLLRQQYYAEGEGLIELTESCRTRLPHDVVKNIHHIVELRQRLLDEDDAEHNLMSDFVFACIQCEKELTPRSGRLIWGVAIVFVLLMTFGTLLFYFVHWDIVSEHLKLNG
ncbi:DUF4145 domain-containing protein [Vibrio aphrogenes]|uniref:DUF4145 domain-containing protein n=1 Tax=Vibrio aphrogenes TaxID=1891186 RepID=UPI000B35AB81|nr:DUF4145 domain-containing protein [Vibrio aphrogenes]